MRAFSVLVAMACAGCGPVWEGSFQGSLRAQSACANGIVVDELVNGVLELREVGNGVIAVDDGGICAPTSVSTAGNQGTVLRKQCQTLIDPEGRFTIDAFVTGGTLRLVEPTLTVDVQERYEINVRGQAPIACTGSTTGSLQRER